ncbi:hypothetical protein ACETRX_29775, partial [Labrys portucalensis]
LRSTCAFVAPIHTQRSTAPAFSTTPRFTSDERSSFFKAVHEPNLRESDKQQLFTALLAIRLVK